MQLCIITRDWRLSLKTGQATKGLTERTGHHGASNMPNGNMDTSALKPITVIISWLTRFFINLNYKTLYSISQHLKPAAWESLWVAGIEFCYKFHMNFDLQLVNAILNWTVLSMLPSFSLSTMTSKQEASKINMPDMWKSC